MQSAVKRLRLRFTRLFFAFLYLTPVPGWRMMNLGFAPVSDEVGTDPTCRSTPYQYELYRQVWRMAEPMPGADCRVAEIACGTGAGLAWIGARSAARLTGYELNPAGRLAARLRFGVTSLPARAPELPMEDGSVDLVMVLETGHAFFDMRFAAELMRVLRPGGQFLQCDFIIEPETRVPRVVATLEGAGLVVEQVRDVASNVLEACRADAPRRTWLTRHLPGALGVEALDLAAAPGSRKFAEMESGRRGYYMLRARKPV